MNKEALAINNGIQFNTAVTANVHSVQSSDREIKTENITAKAQHSSEDCMQQPIRHSGSPPKTGNSGIQLQSPRESTASTSRRSQNRHHQPEWSLEGQNTTMRNAFRTRVQHTDEHQQVIDAQITRSILLAGGAPKPFSPTPRTDVWEKTLEPAIVKKSTRIRVPTPKERRASSKQRQSHVYAVKFSDDESGSIWCSHDDALGAAGRNGDIQRFDAHKTMSRNINLAKSWIKHTDEH